MNPLLPASAQKNLILASNSPRRAAILKNLQLDFKTVPAGPGAEGSVPIDDPEEVALLGARAKAADVAARHVDAVVIGADTVVVVDGDLLGKPADDAEAIGFLSQLSGRTHTVVTGVAVRRESEGIELFGREATRVRFRKVSLSEIEAYVRSGEPKDKAGAYGIQGLGAALVERIDGCYYNVVGLPVVLLFDLLKRV